MARSFKQVASFLVPSYTDGDREVSIFFSLSAVSLGKYKVFIKPNFDTACWVPPAGSVKHHSIFYGDLMLRRTLDFFADKNGIGKLKSGIPFKEAVNLFFRSMSNVMQNALGEMLLKAVKAYARHEREHAIQTDHDLKNVNLELKKVKVPFSLLNLFEDARIEHNSRKHLEGKFNWLDVEPISLTITPTALFFRCIQLEGDEDVEIKAIAHQSTDDSAYPTVGELHARIRHYYDKACACPDTLSLIPLLKAFVAEFGGASSDHSDLENALAVAMEGEAALSELMADCECADDVEDKESKDKGKKIEDVTEADEGSVKEEHFLARGPRHIHPDFQKRVDQLTSTLMVLFKSHKLNTVSDNPGKRMSSRHLARGELKFVRPTQVGGKKVRNYAFVFDCSSSMGGYAAMEGKILLMALNNLAKSGYVKGKLILSGYPNSKVGYLSYSFPVSDSIVERIHCSHGAEGLDSTLRRNAAVLKTMDDVFVYTDGCICDAPMDKDALKQKGVVPVGLYCHDNPSGEELSNMMIHFPQNIIKNTIEKLVESMLIRNKRTL